MVNELGSSIVTGSIELYTSLGHKIPAGQFSILASFALTRSGTAKIISLATGSKCLPTARYPKEGDALHDSHAEVLARRGAVRWFLEEMQRVVTGQITDSAWIQQTEDGMFELRSGVHLHMYVSTVPCGDASMRYLASFQDEAMAALKDSAPQPSLPLGTASRGRNNYSLYGVLRTKPGRADSLPTLCMSCSDKIARWNILGIQGAMTSHLLKPVYLSAIIIGEVEQHMRDTVLEDCQRAFWGRLISADRGPLPPDYRLARPTVVFDDTPFVQSRTVLHATASCNDSLCWIADSTTRHEVLINGVKRGISPKHRHNPKFRPMLCKAAMLDLFQQISAQRGPSFQRLAYHETKRCASDYQEVKSVLQGESGPFAGWVQSGIEWEAFVTR